MSELGFMRIAPRNRLLANRTLVVSCYISCVLFRPREMYRSESAPIHPHSLKYRQSFRPFSNRSLSSFVMAPGSIEKERSISSDEKEKSKLHVAVYTLDTAAILAAAEDVILTPEEAKRLRRKIDWHILPLMYSAFIFIFTRKLHMTESLDQFSIGFSSWTKIRWGILPSWESERTPNSRLTST